MIAAALIMAVERMPQRSGLEVTVGDEFLP
jgi:hypothetical protein